MRDRKPQELALLRLMVNGESVVRFRVRIVTSADKFQIRIADQSAGQQSRFGQHLKSVANAEHQAAGCANLLHGAHHRRKLGNGAAAQIVAIGESAGQNDGIDIAQRGGFVPDEFGLLVQIMRDRVPRIVVAVAAGKTTTPTFIRLGTG